jgi:hypothetical protein
MASTARAVHHCQKVLAYDLGIRQSVLETVAYRVMLAALVAGGVVAWNVHGSRSTTPGMRRRRQTAKQKMIKLVSRTNRRKRPMNVKRSRGSTSAQ